MKLLNFDNNGYIDYASGKMQAHWSSSFGSDATTLAEMWADLQQTTIPEAQIENATEKDLDYFLLTHHWFKTYPTFMAMALTFQKLRIRHTISDWVWSFVYRIAALNTNK